MSADLSAEARQKLLTLARDAIAARLAGRPAPPIPQDPELHQPRGVFVTLEEKGSGDLRGCIGHIAADMSLGEAVAQMAVAAALEDSRFQAVGEAELEALHIEISALGPLTRVKPEEVVVGAHGLLVRHEGRSGLLLPQVATDHDWDRETFLDFTCRKARLPAGTWRDPRCEIQAFTATVFGEQE